MSEISYQLRLIADETTYPVLLGEAADEIERLTGRAGRAERACQALLVALEPINFDSNWPRLIDDLEAAMRQAAGLHEGRVAP